MMPQALTPQWSLTIWVCCRLTLHQGKWVLTAARLFLREVSTLTTQMHVTSLPGMAPADYIHKKLPPYWQGHLQHYSSHSISAKVNSHVINDLNTIKHVLTVTLQTDTTVKLVPTMPTKRVTTKLKPNKEHVTQNVPTENTIYFNFNFCPSSSTPKSCTLL